jgi:hypothetical protein
MELPFVKNLISFLFFLGTTVLLNARLGDAPNRLPSYPYITGDGFREHCDFVIDETNQRLNPADVKNGSKIFVKTDYLLFFFTKYHSLINANYILVSHNNDSLIVSEELQGYLNDKKILAWFAQNAQISHPKLIPIPTGLKNRSDPLGDPKPVDNLWKRFEGIKSHLLFINFNFEEFSSEKEALLNFFMSKPFCTVSSTKSYTEYLEGMAVSDFVLCSKPSGNDSHQLWEALYMNAFPIIKASSQDYLYRGLPVIIVKGWDEITLSFLQNSIQRMEDKNIRYEKLYMGYWLDLMDAKAKRTK